MNPFKLDWSKGAEEAATLVHALMALAAVCLIIVGVVG